MKLIDLTVDGFLDKTAGKDPVPGGGSISALNGAIAAALTEMVANLTIGREKYKEHEELMNRIASLASDYRMSLAKDIDADSDAYDQVFNAFKLPKDTDEQKTERSKKIQEATKVAAEVPLEVARKCVAMMKAIAQVAEYGNQNAVTDAAVAMMAARTATLGAALNVRINLSSLKDGEYVARVSEELAGLEQEAIENEQKLLASVRQKL